MPTPNPEPTKPSNTMNPTETARPDASERFAGIDDVPPAPMPPVQPTSSTPGSTPPSSPTIDYTLDYDGAVAEYKAMMMRVHGCELLTLSEG